MGWSNELNAEKVLADLGKVPETDRQRPLLMKVEFQFSSSQEAQENI